MALFAAKLPYDGALEIVKNDKTAFFQAKHFKKCPTNVNAPINIKDLRMGIMHMSKVTA